MYCKKCYRPLDPAADALHCCPKCNSAYDPADPKTYLRRPFPPAVVVISQIISTTILAGFAAYVVAFHQTARTSGH